MKNVMILVMALCVAATTFSQTNWHLKASDDGVNVYTGDTPGSKIKCIKVECTLRATLSQMAIVLLDINGSMDWVYNTKSTTILKQVSPSELYYYSEVNVPWPVNNRDFVAHLKITQNPATRVMVMDAENAPDMVPQKANTVRVMQSVGKWVITPIGANTVKIEYTLFCDPGGSVPAWLINMFATKGPMESFHKLKDVIAKPAYRYARVSFIKD